jgi:hypothetical protein
MLTDIYVEKPKTISNHLTGHIKSVDKISPVERNQMIALLRHYFSNVTRNEFEDDLAEKEWAILLCDSVTNHIKGFSTLMRLQTRVDGQSIVAFFSGDTIIHRDYWGETELPRLWGKHVFHLAATMPDTRVYWFLICSGYKTYRFLPVFFREFYPTYRCVTPPTIKKTIDVLAQLKFPTEYDPARGIICLKRAAPLQPGIAEITERRLKDPHITFFARANPGHIYGEELACLTEITPANLTRAGRRILEAK